MAVTRRLAAFVALTLLATAACAKVLPEDRADVLWHGYDGGGVTIQGPSVLVRKAYKDKVSVWGNYYVDMISGASIDVQATASKYAEERKEFSMGVDYLHDRTLMGVGFTQSDESDYHADTLNLSLSQDFFGDLTTVSMGYAYGSDTVKRNGDPNFQDDANHQSFSIELSQILTRRLVLNLGYESVVDEGFLNNPYRSVRFADSQAAAGYSYQAERYPRTRASDAAAIRAMLYLPWRAALRGEARAYTDSWGIGANNYEISLTQPLPANLELDVNVRHYAQDEADFYSDLFPYRDAQNFLARDKELSKFTNTSFGLGLGYTFGKEGFLIFSKGSINFFADYVMFRYDNFSDVTVGAAVGDEPEYRFNAVVARIYLSLWF